MSLWSDVCYALRVLSKNRSFTAVAVLTLVVSIGANTAIFSMADAIVFHPYPFQDLDRIAALWETIPAVSAELYAVSPGDYFDWKEQSRAFAGMAAYRSWDATLTGAHDPQRVRGVLVSTGFFPLLSLPAAKGRFFSGELAPSERNQVVISYGFWQQRLGSDPHVLGTPLELNGLTYAVIGVMPKEMDFPMYAEVWAPWIATPEEKADRIHRDLSVIARFQPRASLSTARAEMNHLAARLARQYPLTNAGRAVGVMLLRESVDDYAGRFMVVVTGAVAFLLLLACANVANLQLARGAVRRREMALRIALGASRARIARQLITEGIVLSSCGAGLGLPLAVWGLKVIKANIPQLVSRHLPGLLSVGLDARMLVLTLAAAALTGIVFTLPAAIQACTESLAATLKEGGRGTQAPGRRRTRSVLVIAEIGVSIVLLVGAGLMVKGFRNLATMKPGFEPRDVVTFTVALPGEKYRESYQRVNFYSEMLRRLGDISGVDSAAVISELPALADSRTSTISIEGQPAASPDRPLVAEVRITSEDYFQTMNIPVLNGRPFLSQDNAGGLPVAVISKTAARRFWPGQNALGQRVRLASTELNTNWLTIVGIVGDVNHFLLDNEVRPTFYLPYRQQPLRSLDLVLRTRAPLDQTAIAVRAAGRAVDPAQPIYDLERVGKFFEDLAGGVGVIAALLGVFAVVALILAAAGIYAVMAYAAAQRTQEIGIRMALGARPEDVWRLIIGNALRLVGIGLGLGLPVALALSAAVSSSLPGVIALDPLTFAGFSILLAAVALLASFIPSRRATRVDPVAALRAE
jgi:putative ABC transport system permease protein